LFIDNLLTVTLEQLTQFYMHKQFLASGDREAGLRDVVNTLCGLHAQNSLTHTFRSGTESVVSNLNCWILPFTKKKV
jgi:hypothetical protein